MDLYPKSPDLEKPPVAAGVVLVGLQIVIGMIAVFVGSLISVSGGSTWSMVGALSAAMGYAIWLENKVPGALSRKSMLLWFALIGTSVQIGLALIYLVLMSLAARADGGVQLPPIGFLLAVIPIAGGLFFGVSWLGLWSGRRIVQKQRAKAEPPAA